ncbi:HD domain-containing protein [Tribonema minus]|uniref:5'-deoxynucleotidase n=1 Tax=Tribonema minus TaxID=303371 RepID=A0A835Z344_9STRA|nr:HD domain-containing protein [Tribonema minus]
MSQAAEASHGTPATPTAGGAIDFLNFVGLLKTLKRTGWVREGVTLPESVADHQYRMGVMSLLITDDSVDKQRCTMMAIVHDLAEALAGDITPLDGVTDEDKHARELRALDQMLAALGEGTHAAALIKGLWEEYEAGATPEALMVKDLDKFEMIVQADEYEREQSMDLSPFFASTAGYFKTTMVQEWDRELRRRRQERLAQRQQNL